jgi:hypothetical protein
MAAWPSSWRRFISFSSVCACSAFFASSASLATDFVLLMSSTIWSYWVFIRLSSSRRGENSLSRVP